MTKLSHCNLHEKFTTQSLLVSYYRDYIKLASTLQLLWAGLVKLIPGQTIEWKIVQFVSCSESLWLLTREQFPSQSLVDSAYRLASQFLTPLLPGPNTGCPQILGEKIRPNEKKCCIFSTICF
jgi:hypothetical protein